MTKVVNFYCFSGVGGSPEGRKFEGENQNFPYPGEKVKKNTVDNQTLSVLDGVPGRLFGLTSGE